MVCRRVRSCGRRGRLRIGNHASVAGLSEEVVDVLADHAGWGQVLFFSETEAKARYSDLTIASLGAIKKEKPNEVVLLTGPTASRSTSVPGFATKRGLPSLLSTVLVSLWNDEDYTIWG